MGSRSRLCAIWFAAAVAVAASACGSEDPGDDEDWLRFRDRAAREIDGRTIYVVELDLVLTHDELHAYYLRLAGDADGTGTLTQASTVNQVNGVDNVWSTDAAQRLTYCVSNTFGTDDHARAVREMAAATREWEAVAHVDFTYLPAHDASCAGTNPGVAFAVAPWALEGACAAFPNNGDACIPRTLLINFADLDDAPFWATRAPGITTLGVFRHELGHVLGLRHEHIRAPMRPNDCLAEAATDLRALTPYDMSSVMHYPWCNGTLTGDFVISDSDVAGIQQLYGPSFAPSETQFAVGSIDSNPRLDILQYHRRWASLPACRYTGNTGSFAFLCTNEAAAIFDSGDPSQQLLVADFNADGRDDAVQASRRWGSYPTCVSTLSGWSCTNPAATIHRHPDDTNEQRFLTGQFVAGPAREIIQVFRKWSSIPLCMTTTGGSPIAWGCTNPGATIYDWGSPEQQFLVGDVDNDGFDDVIQTYRKWTSIPTCRADGAGNWTCTNHPAALKPSTSNEQRFHVGGVDYDGYDDVIQTYRGWSSIPVCRSLAGAGWSCTDRPATVHDSGSSEQQFLTGDFDGDGRTDVVQAYRGWSSLPLCLSTGTGWSCVDQAATIHNSGSREQRFVAADIDRDGRSDVVQVHRGWSSYPVCFSRPGWWDCQNLPATVFNPGVL